MFEFRVTFFCSIPKYCSYFVTIYYDVHLQRTMKYSVYKLVRNKTPHMWSHVTLYPINSFHYSKTWFSKSCFTNKCSMPLQLSYYNSKIFINFLFSKVFFLLFFWKILIIDNILLTKRTASSSPPVY